MIIREIIVTAEVGLHARPAAEFAKIAKESGLTITVGKAGGLAVSAASPLRLLTLKVSTNECITVSIDSDDSGFANEVLDRLAAAVR